MSKTTPYIDAEYYINEYKATKNARITGTFNNVEQHQLDFDAFRNRASEIVDRLLSGKVSALGGIDAMSDTYAKELIRKATGAFVEHWFIKGFTMADLNSTLSIGSLNAQNVISVKSFREIAPLSALANLQKTGMWDHKAVGVNLSKELKDAGIDPSEIVTWADALAVFEAKDEGLNFHIEGDMSGELTGIAGKSRFIKILETTQLKSSFEIIGGTDEFTKTNIEFQRDANDVIIKAEALIYSAVAAPDAAGWWYKIEDGKTIIYMEVKDDQDEKRFAISNAYPDRDGLYGVLGSTDNSAGLAEMSKVSIIDSVVNISLKTITEYADQAEFATEPIGSIGYVKNADEEQSYDILLMTPDGIRIFRDFETIMGGVQAALNLLDERITIAQESADAALAAAQAADAKAEKNAQAISDSNNAIAQKQDEVNLGTNGIKVFKKTGTFSSKDQNGVRQTATDSDDLVDVEFVKEITDPLAQRTANLEAANNENLKKSDTKTPISSTNKIITENELNELEQNHDGRIDDLETAQELDDKVWNGNIQLTANGVGDISAIVDQDGTPFDFKAGTRLEIYIKHSADNNGVGHSVVSDDSTLINFVIPTGNASDSIGAQLTAAGIVNAMMLNGNDNIAEFAIYRVLAPLKQNSISNSYSKTVSDGKYASKAEGALATKLGGVKVSGNRDLSDIPDDGNKENTISTEEYVDDSNAALDTKIMAAVKVIEDARVKYEKGRVLSYAEQKTTGAFADRTLFSETAIPKGLAILGGTGGVESVGQVGEIPVKNRIDMEVLDGIGTPSDYYTLAGSDGQIYTGANEGKNKGVKFTPFGDNVNSGKDNLAKGIEIVAYVYTALKDITNGDMEK